MTILGYAEKAGRSEDGDSGGPEGSSGEVIILA